MKLLQVITQHRLLICFLKNSLKGGDGVTVNWQSFMAYFVERMFVVIGGERKC